ncbi:4-amino-4-deoxy-L-arabinose transferase, partial [Microbacterium sp. SUBG005]
GGGDGSNRGGGFGAGAGAGTADTALISWLEQKAAGSTYLAATFGAQSAASLIIASDGGSFLPIGGFNGTDAVPTLDEFVALVESGQVRYVIEGQERGGGFGSSTTATSSTSAQIRDWVGQNCVIDSSAPSTVYACG